MADDLPINNTQDGSLSGDPLVGVAKEWSEGRKPVELCRELFVRWLQLSLAVTQLCHLAGIKIDDAMAQAVERYRTNNPEGKT